MYTIQYNEQIPLSQITFQFKMSIIYNKIRIQQNLKNSKNQQQITPKMSSSIPIIQSLSSLQNSPLYCPQIPLSAIRSHYSQYKCQLQHISNPIQIRPPQIWFNIQQSKCYASIKNDIQRSRSTRQGLLSTNVKGNVMNRISYQNRDQDIGTIQEMEQCFTVAFAVVKDSFEEFFKTIGIQLRSCLIRKSSLVDTSHLQISQLDQLSKQIYNRYRIFLIFDTKSQPGRVISFHSCFYPNVHFTMTKIKKKQSMKFSPNEPLKQVQSGQLMNTYGFLALDNKKRLLIIKKDDPQLMQQNAVGVWIVSSYQSNRTKKQFAKQDAIWIALLDFYTNPDIKNKLSIIQKNKGLLCYVAFRKQKNKIDIPQFYLFEPNSKILPKWSFTTKNEIMSQTNKSCQIKIQFNNSVIVQQRQYSQFSDQQNSYQDINNRNKNQNFNRENMIKYQQKTNNGINNAGNNAGNNGVNVMMKSDGFQKNSSGFSGSSQERTQRETKKSKDDDQKNTIIKELKVQLEKYKQRCLELEAMNKILMQEKIMNPMMYPPQYQIPQIYGQYNPQQPYPLSYSQVTASTSPSPYNTQPHPHQYPYNPVPSPLVPPTIIQSPHSPQQQNLPTTKITQSRVQQQQISIQVNDKKLGPAFQNYINQQFTFGQGMGDANKLKQKSFVKKSQSYDLNANANGDTDQNKRQLNNEVQKIIIQKMKDMRNISFQDSFAQYHSDGQQQGPTFNMGNDQNNSEPMFFNKQLQKQFNGHQFDSLKKNSKNNEDCEEQYDVGYGKSPEFKKIHSLQHQSGQKQKDEIQSQTKSKQSKSAITSNQDKQSTKFVNKANLTSSNKSQQQKPTTEGQTTLPKQVKSPQNSQIVKKTQPTYIQKRPSKIQVSDQSQQQQKPKNSPPTITKPPLSPKPTQKQQLTPQNKQSDRHKQQKQKKKKSDSDSDDSDQDCRLQKIKQRYRNR